MLWRNLIEMPFTISAQDQAWPRSQVPRRAEVSSFGLAGANVYVIVEEAPEPLHASGPEPAAQVYVLPLSAREPVALQQVVGQYASYLESGPALSRTC